MSDWENDDEPVAQASQPVVPKLTASGRKKFDDEDVEDQIKDDWEEDDSEPEPAANSRSAVPLPAQKKKSVKQKIAEKEENERKRRELGLNNADDSDDLGEWDEDPIAKRRMEREAQLKSDVENAANLLGTSKLADDDSVSTLKTANPQSKEDWEAFSDSVFNDLLKPQSTKPGFDKHFAGHLFKNVCSTLRDVEIRKLSAMLKTYAEDKVKQEKEAKKMGGQKKAPKPKTVGTASAKNVIDTRAYGEEALDDDDLDFM